MGARASQITGLAIVYSTVYSDADQRKHQSSASLAFVRGIHRGPLNSPHKWPVTRKMLPFDDIIMVWLTAAARAVRVVSLAMSQLHDFPRTNEVTLKNMNKINSYLITTKLNKMQTLRISPGVCFTFTVKTVGSIIAYLGHISTSQGCNIRNQLIRSQCFLLALFIYRKCFPTIRHSVHVLWYFLVVCYC